MEHTASTLIARATKYVYDLKLDLKERLLKAGLILSEVAEDEVPLRVLEGFCELGKLLGLCRESRVTRDCFADELKDRIDNLSEEQQLRAVYLIIQVDYGMNEANSTNTSRLRVDFDGAERIRQRIALD